MAQRCFKGKAATTESSDLLLLGTWLCLWGTTTYTALLSCICGWQGKWHKSTWWNSNNSGLTEMVFKEQFRISKYFTCFETARVFVQHLLEYCVKQSCILSSLLFFLEKLLFQVYRLPIYNIIYWNKLQQVKKRFILSIPLIWVHYFHLSLFINTFMFSFGPGLCNLIYMTHRSESFWSPISEIERGKKRQL